MSDIVTNFREQATHIVFFDGVCNLCNGAVTWLIDHDVRKSLVFAPLQGESYRRILTHDISLKSVITQASCKSIAWQYGEEITAKEKEEKKKEENELAKERSKDEVATIIFRTTQSAHAGAYHRTEGKIIQYYDQSDAVIRIIATLGGFYRFALALLLIPRFLRNALYQFIARRRYRYFGKSSTCRLPTPELLERFLP